MSQLTLFPTTDERPPTLRERFEQFHADNPQVYDGLRELALRARRRGHERYGIKGLFEILRWQHAMETTDEEFKLNNDFTAFYARLLMDREFELDGFFETREQKC